MAFTSFKFLAFVCIVVAIYYIAPKKGRWVVLLIGSYAFYLFSSPKTFLFLIFTTTVTFFGGRVLNIRNSEYKQYIKEHKELKRTEKKAIKSDVQRKKRKIVTIILIADFGVLAAVKYLSPLLKAFGFEPGFNLGALIPLGISFYTFQSAAYIIDIYRGKIEADQNIAKFALFTSFFPQIMQGPIARYDHLAHQLYEGHDFSYKNLTYGAQLMLWGFFKKLVIADRVAVLVNEIFNNYTEYNGFIIFVGLLGYTLQIYADFSGGIDIARGVARIMGINMAQNFKRPYFANSLSEFWRRWHMSLSFWCRDYIFFTISLSKTFGKAGKNLRKIFGDRVGKLFPVIVAQMATFITIGIWHGPSFKYVAYGLYNGIIIVVGLLLEPYLNTVAEKLHVNKKSKGWKIFSVLRTFMIVVIGRMFSKAISFEAAISMYSAMLRPSKVSFAEQLFSLGLDGADFVILALSCVVWFIISWHQEKGESIRDNIAQMSMPARWAIFIVSFALICIVGVYGPGYDASAFIYRGF